MSRMIGTFILILCVTTGARAQYSDNTPAFGTARPSFAHMLDIVIEGSFAYVVGSGGLWIIDISNDSNPDILSTFQPAGGGRGGTIYGLAKNGNMIYCCKRTNGVGILDVTNPFSPVSVGQNYLRDSNYSYEQALVIGNYLYLAAHDHGVEVVDISTPQQLQHVIEVQTENAYALAFSGNHLFVADGTAGLTVINISSPTSPQLVKSIKTTALAQDVVIDGTHAYIAVGSSGMDVFDISNPAEPVFAANYYVEGFTNHLNIDNDRAYLANWETVEIVDISNPSHPRLVGTQQAAARAMAIAVKGNKFYVGDWNTFRIYHYENFPVPDINVDPIELSFGSVLVGSSQQLEIRIENFGEEPLIVSSISASGSGFSVQSSSFTLNQFESREVPVLYQPPNSQNHTGIITIQSNDPDEKNKNIPLIGGTHTIGVGDTPPDFTLQDINGKSYHLMDYIIEGTVIVMTFYASW